MFNTIQKLYMIKTKKISLAMKILSVTFERAISEKRWDQSHIKLDYCLSVRWGKGDIICSVMEKEKSMVATWELGRGQVIWI